MNKISFCLGNESRRTRQRAIGARLLSPKGKTLNIGKHTLIPKGPRIHGFKIKKLKNKIHVYKKIT